ncbi:FAD-dependent oxidoreductase [Thiofilum flexile]|uniref:FAD-dependent oxidoreductase n=1 Tax=Thiofilum flexile TaxID=125627 RepID=UPI00035C8D41|nr:bifunctional TVP38/TMEM64 family protein/FAD-dependent oxidoreductase [Thiofilum flexile]
MKKLLLVVVLFVLVILFFSFDGQTFLTLDYLKSSHLQFTRWYELHPWLVTGVFFLFYIAITALSLPGAALLTLAAGAWFGLGVGLVLVSFASSIGATLAFLVARYLARDHVQQRFARQLQALNAGIEQEGALYLLTLRLVPLIPFFIINMLMGLTRMPVRTFYGVSQLGMLPGTLVYVNAGTQLGKVQSTAEILSPALIGSLVVLALFPWLAKAIVNYWKRRQVYHGWSKPKQFERNLIVIGAGAAGLVSSYIAAAVKAKVTLIEAHKMGGDCLNYGCVPSKALIKSANVAHQVARAQQWGIMASGQVDFKAVMQRLAQVIKAIEPHDSMERYTELGVEVVQGRATLTDPWTVEVSLPDGSTCRLTARSIILATGASPVIPKIKGIEKSGYVTSETLWERLAQYEQIPSEIVIMGGGAIGCELAQALQRLGAKVTLIVRAERLIRRDDEEISLLVQQHLEREGVRVLTQCEWLACEQGAMNTVVLQQQEQILTLPYELLIFALGREPRLKGLGLERLGIEPDSPLAVDDYLATRYPHIYVAGDVVGEMQFTHVAAHHAWYAAVNSLFGIVRRFKVDRRVIPRVMFTDPEVAQVGLNEQMAQQQGITYEVSRFDLAELDRAITEGLRDGFIKVLTVPQSDKILGVTIVGTHAGELLAEYTLAMKQGIGLNKLLGTIHPYPTWGEANKYAAGVWKKAHAPRFLLKVITYFHQWRRG